MNPQLGLEVVEVSKMEFEFEFLFQPGLKVTFEVEFEFDFELKSEIALEVASELEFEFASSSTPLPAFLSSVNETTATCDKKPSLNSIFMSILFEN